MGFSGSVAYAVFLDHGLNVCPLHWQADFCLLCHQESPGVSFHAAGLSVQTVSTMFQLQTYRRLTLENKFMLLIQTADLVLNEAF